MSSIFDAKIGFLDLETTGLIRKVDKIVEVAIVKTNLDKSFTIEPSGYHKYLNPGFHIPAGASKVHKIYDNHVASKPRFNEKIAKEIVEFCQDIDIFCAHNHAFDKPRIIDEIRMAGQEPPKQMFKPWIDTLLVWNSPKMLPFKSALNLKNLKLSTIGKAFDIDWNAHNGLEDTIALMKIFLSMAKEEMIPSNIQEIIRMQNNG